MCTRWRAVRVQERMACIKGEVEESRTNQCEMNFSKSLSISSLGILKATVS
jgi:hypothetical protein